MEFRYYFERQIVVARKIANITEAAVQACISQFYEIMTKRPAQSVGVNAVPHEKGFERQFDAMSVKKQNWRWRDAMVRRRVPM